MAGPVVGIDLGTLNSCVAVVKDGKAVVLADEARTTTPSCVAIHQGRELVGAAAKRHAVTSPQSTVIAVKRLMGHAFDSDEVRAAAARVPYTLSASPLGGVVLEVENSQLTPVEVSAWTKPTTPTSGFLFRVSSSFCGSHGWPHSSSTTIGMPPARSTFSIMRPPNTPLRQTTTLSPGATMFTKQYSMPTEPGPETGKVRAFFVW